MTSKHYRTFDEAGNGQRLADLVLNANVKRVVDGSLSDNFGAAFAEAMELARDINAERLARNERAKAEREQRARWEQAQADRKRANKEAAMEGAVKLSSSSHVSCDALATSGSGFISHGCSKSAAWSKNGLNFCGTHVRKEQVRITRYAQSRLDAAAK